MQPQGPMPQDDDEGSFTISITKPGGTTWERIFTGWWVVPAVFAIVFGVPVLLCFVGAVVGRGTN